MGLTIHYGLTSKTRSTERAKALVERMRQLALDLPFEKADDTVQHLGPDVCQRPLDDLRPNQESVFDCAWAVASTSAIPWHRKQSCQRRPYSPWKSFRSGQCPAPAANGLASVLPATQQISK